MMKEMKDMKKPWNPYLAGVFLGLVLLLAYVWLGHGIGASGAATILGAISLHSIVPEHITANGAYLAHYFTDGQNPLNDWIIFMAIGIFIGGFISSSSPGGSRQRLSRAPTQPGVNVFFSPFWAALSWASEPA
jgi:uncharacterized protein